MEFKRSSIVVSSDGVKMGKLERVVIDPATKKVASLVIERGLLFPEDKLVPVDVVERVEDRQVILKSGRKALEDLNVFEETHYIPLNKEDEELEAYYWYPPVQGLTDSPYPVLPYPIYVESRRQNIPENYVALKEGAQVLDEDGKHVGHLEQVITDPKTDQATHLVVSSGFLSREKKLLPAYWIKDVSEEKIYLSVNSKLFDRLVDFEPQK